MGLVLLGVSIETVDGDHSLMTSSHPLERCSGRSESGSKESGNGEHPRKRSSRRRGYHPRQRKESGGEGRGVAKRWGGGEKEKWQAEARGGGAGVSGGERGGRSGGERRREGRVEGEGGSSKFEGRSEK